MLYITERETKNIETLKALLKAGYNYITEMGYAVEHQESTDDKSIVGIICKLEAN